MQWPVSCSTSYSQRSQQSQRSIGRPRPSCSTSARSWEAPHFHWTRSLQCLPSLASTLLPGPSNLVQERRESEEGKKHPHTNQRWTTQHPILDTVPSSTSLGSWPPLRGEEKKNATQLWRYEDRWLTPYHDPPGLKENEAPAELPKCLGSGKQTRGTVQLRLRTDTPPPLPFSSHPPLPRPWGAIGVGRTRQQTHRQLRFFGVVSGGGWK